MQSPQREIAARSVVRQRRALHLVTQRRVLDEQVLLRRDDARDDFSVQIGAHNLCLSPQGAERQSQQPCLRDEDGAICGEQREHGEDQRTPGGEAIGGRHVRREHYDIKPGVEQHSRDETEQR